MLCGNGKEGDRESSGQVEKNQPKPEDGVVYIFKAKLRPVGTAAVR